MGINLLYELALVFLLFQDLGSARAMMKYLDPNHSLLVAVSSVKELGLRTDEWESESEGSVGG